MTKKLYRSTEDAKVLGICGGIGEYLGVDSTLVRIIAFVIILSMSIVPGLIIYFVLAMIIPKRPLSGRPDYPRDYPDNHN